MTTHRYMEDQPRQIRVYAGAVRKIIAWHVVRSLTIAPAG